MFRLVERQLAPFEDAAGHFDRFLDAVGRKPSEPPQANEGTNLGGKPVPKMFALTPTTVPVLNMVLMLHLEWSPMISPQNCSRVFT